MNPTRLLPTKDRVRPLIRVNKEGKKSPLIFEKIIGGVWRGFIKMEIKIGKGTNFIINALSLWYVCSVVNISDGHL